jgi:CelD/BcsL family acetyltransferase involved in cellulose biosynthesis
MSSKLTIRVFRGLDGLRSLENVWPVVLQAIERPEFFYQYEWYETALATWPAEAGDTFFVVAYRQDAPIAICPLRLSESRVLGVPVRTLSVPDPHSVSYTDFISAKDDRADLLPLVLAELRSSSEIDWDVLTLPKCFHNAAVAPTSDRLATTPGVFRHRRDVCYYFRCDQGMEAINANMSKGLRGDIRRCRRQFGQLGTLEFVYSRDSEKLPELFEEFLTLEASGWKGAQGEGTAIKLDPTLVRFYSTLMTRFGATRNCEINIMRLDGRNIAGNFSLISDGTWNQLKIAYDEEFRKQSPGYVLIDGMLSRLCDDPLVHTANILTGADWAERLHGEALEVWRVVARNRTLQGHAALQETKLRRLVHDRAVPFVKRVSRKLKRRAS